MDYIKLDQNESVVTLTIDRPDSLNALNIEVLTELETALDAIDTSAVRCLIIRGAGTKAFVSGADISEMSDFDSAESREFSSLGNRVFIKLESLPIATIAAVCGYALGGGCELSMACDIRIASETAVFSQPEMGLGIIPGFGGTQRLALLVGIGRAKEILYTGRRISASEAMQIGLCNAVYPVDTVFEKANEMARRISLASPVALAALKRAVNENFIDDIHVGTAVESKLFASCFGTDEQKAAMAAFLKKTSSKKEK